MRHFIAPGAGFFTERINHMGHAASLRRRYSFRREWSLSGHVPNLLNVRLILGGGVVRIAVTPYQFQALAAVIVATR